MTLGRSKEAGMRQTALRVALFALVWGAATHVAALIYNVPGAEPLYPALAVDIVALLLLGWGWWPLIPCVAVLDQLAFEHSSLTSLATTAVIQALLGLIFGLAVRYVRTGQRIDLPMRTLRDVIVFCAFVGVVASALFALSATTVFVIMGRVAPEHTPLQFLHFFLGDVTSVIALVPMAIAFIGWNSYIVPPEHVEPSRGEVGLSVAATAAFVVGGTILASVTHEPILDLSFVAMSWLSIRLGFRGAALGTLTAYLSAAAVHAVLHLPGDILIESEGFLVSSSLMALLLAGLTYERWQLHATLSRRAYVDDLTGLPNRERLVAWLEDHQNDPVVFVIVAVDDLTVLNQGIGRAATDRVLQQIALRMRTTFPFSHMVARVGADEFAVAVVDDRSPHALMTELRGFFDAPFDVDDAHVFVSSALGAVRTIRAGSADEMLRKVDAALQQAKLSPTRSAVYSPELQHSNTASLVTELYRAVELDELVPFYQPIHRYDPLTRRWVVVGAEALLRWNHPERGLLAPADFIDLLERLSLGEQVGWTMMERCLRQAMQWRANVPEFHVWVNLFTRQALGRGCSLRIAKLLERLNVPANALVVEINERIVASDERDVAQLAAELREIGVASAIDDFGTGGSSLGRVRDVPATFLKIDRSFVNRSEVDVKARAVAATVVRLGTELGMDIVAEGVENLMQLHVMQETGCTFAQGYALGHPLPADLFAQSFFQLERTGS